MSRGMREDYHCAGYVLAFLSISLFPVAGWGLLSYVGHCFGNSLLHWILGFLSTALLVFCFVVCRRLVSKDHFTMKSKVLHFIAIHPIISIVLAWFSYARLSRPGQNEISSFLWWQYSTALGL